MPMHVEKRRPKIYDGTHFPSFPPDPTTPDVGVRSSFMWQAAAIGRLELWHNLNICEGREAHCLGTMLGTVKS